MLRKGGILMMQLRMMAVAVMAFGGLHSAYGIHVRAEQADAHHEHFSQCAKACAGSRKALRRAP